MQFKLNPGSSLLRKGSQRAQVFHSRKLIKQLYTNYNCTKTKRMNSICCSPTPERELTTEEQYMEELKTKHKAVYDKAQAAIGTVYRALELYGVNHLAFSFNGGKDSTVLLHIIRLALEKYREDNHKRDETFIPTFYFDHENDFPEIKRFVHDCDSQYMLNIDVLTGDFQQGLVNYIDDKQCTAILLGTRRNDPNAVGQDLFCPSSSGWPPFMRVNPLLDWNYLDVWAFLKCLKLPYCQLYDQGYTSIGSVNSTKQNSALLKTDGTYNPAHMLTNGHLERQGRTNSTAPKEETTQQHTAGLLIIGDELLSGKVPDINTPYLIKQLRSIGWRVGKVVTVGDSVSDIASELRLLESSFDAVITSGGVGPTPDDVTMEGVAAALDTHLSPHTTLTTTITNFFGDNTTPAHLKMGQTPHGRTEIFFPLDEDGKPNPFPTVRCSKTFVLPGIPGLLQKKWDGVKQALLKGGSPAPFKSLVLRVCSGDETVIVPAMETTMAEVGGEVMIGSYPVTEQEDGARVLVSMESRDWDKLQEAKEVFTGCVSEGLVIGVEEDVEELVKGGD